MRLGEDKGKRFIDFFFFIFNFFSSRSQQAILSRFERSSTALVLWQPPTKITELIANVERERKAATDDDAERDNNNSTSSIDFNNSMDLDL